MAFTYPEGYAYVDHIADHGHTVVVKALSPTGDEIALKVQDNLGNRPRRFQREIGTMHRAAGPNTMPVLDHDDTYAWYAMPLASKTLADEWVPVAQPQDALAILRAIAGSLGPIHANGQVHRDLKPENILFLPGEGPGRWVVADFGIVRNAPGLTTATLTAQGTLTGTWAWAAPEQHRDAHSATPATDVYSAGLLMGWLLTGDLPAPGVRYSALGTLTSTIMRATEPDQSRRFQSMDEFLAHFNGHMLPARMTLDTFFVDGIYGEIHGYLLGRPDQLPPLAIRMIQLDTGQISAWISSDRFGLVETVKQVCEGLGEHFNAVGRNNVDSFLVWLLSVCDALKRANHMDGLAVVLSAQMSATQHLDQWTPRRATLDWVDRQGSAVEAVVRSVMEQTDTWDFFAIEARGHWASTRRTSLVRDLADS